MRCKGSVRDVTARNLDNFRVMGPDETVSNRADTLQTRLHILRGSHLFAGMPADAF